VVRARRAIGGAVAIVAITAALLAPAPSASTTADATKNRIAGMGFITQNKLLVGANIDMGRVAKLGVNMVLFDVWWVVHEGTSSVSPEPVESIDDNLLRTAIRQARSKGMHVALMPKFSARPGHGWRGHFKPKFREVFWRSYRGMINHYAQLGREEGVRLLFVGSEMAALDTEEAEWRQVIREARARFPGLISYNENQDATRPTQITWWDAVDIVSSTGYFPLTGTKAPGIKELKTRWEQTGVRKLLDMAVTTGKPVMLGEVGYMASSYTGREPYAESYGDYRPDLQLRAYQAMLEVLYRYPWYAGEFWWSWNGNPYRTPKDKPAEDLLKAWYAWGWRPGSGPSPEFTGLPLPVPLRQLP
jgi:hypothetical protein